MTSDDMNITLLEKNDLINIAILMKYPNTEVDIEGWKHVITG